MNIQNKTKMTEKIKSISPLISQIVLRHLGLYSSERLSVDIYSLMEAVNILISDFGEDYLKQEYKKIGKDWGEIKVKLDTINKLVTKTKIFYDPIIDKKFAKETTDVNKVQSMFKKHFIKTASKISLMQREIYDLFIFLIKNCTIQRLSIPSDAFKILEHRKFGRVDLSKRRHDMPITNVVGE